MTRRRGRLPNAIVGWSMTSPALLVLFIFTAWPIITSLVRSFDAPVGSGLGNYTRLATDDVFRKVLVNNALFVVGTVPTSMAIALLMAVWVDQKLRGRGLLRLAYFTPSVLPMIAMASLWLFLYTPGYGPVDLLLEAMALPTRNWLGDPTTALPAIMVMVVWKEAGLFMLFYLAALQNMSPELEEASILEGAGRWYHFRRVTWPLLMPTTLFVSVVAIINAFKQVDQLFIMTDGGPNNSSNLILYYIYQQGFRFYDLPYAATLTVVLILILSILAAIQIGGLDRRIHYR